MVILFAKLSALSLSLPPAWPDARPTYRLHPHTHTAHQNLPEHAYIISEDADLGGTLSFQSVTAFDAAIVSMNMLLEVTVKAPLPSLIVLLHTELWKSM